MLKRREFWNDYLFWIAAACGPVCCLLLVVAGLPVNYNPLNWLLIFWSVLVYPVLEEIVFRGGLQTFLMAREVFKRRYLGVSLANVVTSVLFAVLHLVSHAPVWAALIFIPSLVFGAARDRYDGIAASIILHMLYNAGFIALFVR
ncbi:MAG: JDVT-CTERM system CAAX-type protease [Granulosicoccus sp.]|nr:JDVT-CTERM system CAAX-type protease [Granulosicoccus sp.]